MIEGLLYNSLKAISTLARATALSYDVAYTL
jgi:hypothetical protein